jgi:hypothetical protein
MFRSPSLSSGQPRNRPAGHVVTAANLGKRFLALVAALDHHIRFPFAFGGFQLDACAAVFSAMNSTPALSATAF